MVQALLIIFLVYLVIGMFKDLGGRKDRKRWSSLMETEDFLRDPKRADAKSRKLANEYRKMRKKARHDKDLAKRLDMLEKGSRSFSSSPSYSSPTYSSPTYSSPTFSQPSYSPPDLSKARELHDMERQIEHLTRTGYAIDADEMREKLNKLKNQGYFDS